MSRMRYTQTIPYTLKFSTKRRNTTKNPLDHHRTARTRPCTGGICVGRGCRLGSAESIGKISHAFVRTVERSTTLTRLADRKDQNLIIRRTYKRTSTVERSIAHAAWTTYISLSSVQRSTRLLHADAQRDHLSSLSFSLSSLSIGSRSVTHSIILRRFDRLQPPYTHTSESMYLARSLPVTPLFSVRDSRRPR